MKFLTLLALLLSISVSALAQRSDVLLEKGWRFHLGDIPGAQEADFDDSAWDSVSIPHDWAITGPFSIGNDLQKVAVTQNFETVATLKTGRTGGLPYIGVGWYRCSFDVPEGRQAELLFDGAMSEAVVYVNGREACRSPYGYSPFHFDATPYLKPEGNVLAVRLENLPFSSRWYPGAGLYRNVHLLTTDKVHVPVWGTHITTPHVEDAFASVHIETEVEGGEGCALKIKTAILAPDGSIAAERIFAGKTGAGQPLVQNFIVEKPELWSPETPALYTAVSEIYDGDRLADKYETRFGIRTMEFIPEKGFFLNGKPRKFHGVCNHHDLGPLGAAVNVSALRHQLLLLKDMGCDAIRTSHNMPTPELVRLCEEMGFMMMIEPFDEWDIAKCENGYHRFFNEESDIPGVTWAERDMVRMLRCWRNSPCVALWSIGNEVPTQCDAQGYKVARFLQDICHREDPTRPCTCGMDQVSCVLDNGFAALIDIPGLNYRTFRYLEAYRDLPHGFILGSETASTVSSRGVYKLPAEKRFGAVDADHQCSSYDLDACWWSNVPDIDFALEDDYPWTMGQFVWTGFDYLGEPTPYDTDAWPNHSSMFGIIDLASIPKDRFYLYRSVWNKDAVTLHVLPHWNWKDGEEVPVFVYTSCPEAEIFINGVSQGRQRKTPTSKAAGLQDESHERRYRLMWDAVRFEKGELRAVAYDADGKAVAETVVRTAGKPHHIEIVSGLSYIGQNDIPALKADGSDLCYLTVRVVDKDGNICPDASDLLRFSVSGAASYKASANGGPTCLDLFHLPCMHAFHGALTVILQAGETPGEAVLKVSGKGLRSASVTLPVL
ncbi:MAG: DUF4982 domain-containing protein [Candidatus Cryptobacteroides sp.]